MPFKSVKQAHFLFANKPQMAKEFAAHTPNFSNLPQRAGMGSNPGSPMNKIPGAMQNPKFGMQNTAVPGNAGSTYTAMLGKGYK